MQGPPLDDGALRSLSLLLCMRLPTHHLSLNNLQEQIAQGGQHYEALQTARALFSRLEGQGKPGQARELALNVAKTFAEAG